jgi:hypothetical protein
MPQIREVVVLDDRSVERPEDGVQLAEIIDAASCAKARLCLVYGPQDAAPEHAAIMGILIDTQDQSVIAYAQADAGPGDFMAPPKDRFEGDQRHEDVNYLVARKFEQQVRECMFVLIERDLPLATTQPSPYQDAGSTPPLEYREVPILLMPNRPAEW